MNRMQETLDKCRGLGDSLGLELQQCRERGREINAGATRTNLDKTGRCGSNPVDFGDEEKALSIIQSMRFNKDGSKPETRKVIAAYLNGLGLKTMTGYAFTDQNIARLEGKIFSAAIYL